MSEVGHKSNKTTLNLFHSSSYRLLPVFELIASAGVLYGPDGARVCAPAAGPRGGDRGASDEFAA